MAYLSDIEIAQQCEMKPITDIAAAAGIDERILDIAYCLDHEQAFLFRIYSVVLFVFLYRGVRADAYVQVPVLCCLTEKLYMAAVKKIIAA